MASSAAQNEDLKINKICDVSNYSAVVTVANRAKVYITGRRKEALDKVVQKYSTGPGKVVALSGDITQKDEIKRLIAEVEKTEPKGIQLQVNNAGIARDDNTKYSKGSPDFKSAQAISDHLLKSDPSSWTETFETM